MGPSFGDIGRKRLGDWEEATCGCSSEEFENSPPLKLSGSLPSPQKKWMSPSPNRQRKHSGTPYPPSHLPTPINHQHRESQCGAQSVLVVFFNLLCTSSHLLQWR